MIVLIGLGLAAGFTGMVWGSHWAVGTATELAAGSRLPPFFIGMTLLAIGTDLPEIANSIVASVSGHGDVNVGDGVGSAATQLTLVLGLLPIIGGTIPVTARGPALTGALTVVALLVLLALIANGHLGRLDALVLLSIWLIGSGLTYRYTSQHQQLTIPEPGGSRLGAALATLAALGLVGVSAMISLWAIIELSELLDAPEFLVSFFVASLGTSLPELAFDLTAIRSGAVALAIGDVFGSSFVDTSLSIGIGPLISPTDVSTDLIVPAIIAAVVVIAIVTLIIARIREHDWRTGTILLGLYAVFFVVLLL